MPVFGKKVTCPTSAELLAFRNGEVDPKKIGSIRWHLTFCDFCAAEFQFYFLYPPLDEVPGEADPMPPHLYELARSILVGEFPEVIDHSDQTNPS
jgi:hypothetical protein